MQKHSSSVFWQTPRLRVVRPHVLRLRPVSLRGTPCRAVRALVRQGVRIGAKKSIAGSEKCAYPEHNRVGSMTVPHMLWVTTMIYHARNAPFHPSIHSIGNVGVQGRVHARVAPLATWVIDHAAYEGRNVRKEIAISIASEWNHTRRACVLDVACGVGTLTQELASESAFSRVVGLDTSPQMVQEAGWRVPSAEFVVANAIDVHRLALNPDIITAAFVMHEMPRSAHRRMIRSLCTASRGSVWLIDICPTYRPRPSMLMGEPFVLAYLDTIDDTIDEEVQRCNRTVTRRQWVEGHVMTWVLTPTSRCAV